MADKIEEMFHSSVPAKVIKYPKGGYSYLFKWSREQDKEKWNRDGYKWGRNRYVRKLTDTISKSCYYVYTSSNCCSKVFRRQVYKDSKFPQKVVICYQGDGRKALHYAQSIIKSGPLSKALFLKNLPLDCTEHLVLSLHPGINRIKVEAAQDNSNTKYALVSFESVDSAVEAKDLLDKRVFMGNAISADFLTQDLPVSCIQDSQSACPSHDPCTLFVTGFDRTMTKRKILELFPTSSSLNLGGLCHDRKKKDSANEAEDGDDVSFRFCYVGYSEEAESRRAHRDLQDRENMVVMFARK